jgi:uncharacterized iron-regulated protein
MIRLTLLFAAIPAFLMAGCSAPNTEPNRPALPPLADLTAYHIVDPSTDTALSIAQAAAALSDADVVFLGETHRHPGNHLAQMALLRALHEKHSDTALSLEQFERDVQTIVDQYLSGDIGEATLREKGRAWDNYPVSYRPLVEYAKENGLAVIASEAPNMVVRCVGRQGPDFLATLPADKQHWSALTLRLEDGPYKDRFVEFAVGNAGHGKSTGEDDTVSAAVLRSFAAQVTRDETMAQSIVQYIDANPGHRVVHLNGSFHSAGFLGTAERVMWDRPDLEVAVVHPIEVADPNNPEIPEDLRGEGTLLLLIQPEPKSYVSDDEERDAIIAQMNFRKSVDCEL